MTNYILPRLLRGLKIVFVQLEILSECWEGFLLACNGSYDLVSGSAGVGYSLKDEQGRLVALGFVDSHMSSLIQAEGAVLVAGLKHAKRLNLTYLRIHSDS